MKTGTRSDNQKTIRTGCEFVIKFRSSADGQTLMVTSVRSEHNHIVSELVYAYHPKERKVDTHTEAEITDMVKLGANRKLVQEHFSEKTGKLITKKDIDNLVLKDKQNNKIRSVHQMCRVYLRLLKLTTQRWRQKLF
jgi:hypothetical protein